MSKLSRPEIPPVLLRIRAASLGYRGHEVLSDVHLELPRGDYLGLVGPNGSGKTTILRAILGLIGPLSGSVEWRVPNVRLGYVPQRQALDDAWPLRVRDLVVMARYERVGLLRRPSREDWQAVDEVMQAAGIVELGDREFASLSGGQRQRTLIARALATRPDILCLDEPTAGMDLSGSTAILNLIADLHRSGITIVFVTHLLNDLVNSATRIGLVRGGRVTIGATQEMITPENLSRLYGIQVGVAEVDRRRLVLAEGTESEVQAGARR